MAGGPVVILMGIVNKLFIVRVSLRYNVFKRLAYVSMRLSCFVSIIKLIHVAVFIC